MSIKLPQVEPDRINEEWEADKDVLANLAANGDRPHIPRAVDVSFRGPQAALDKVLEIADRFGFVELDREDDEEEGDPYLFLEIEQAVDEASIRALTKTCLQIEQLCGVEYDGWGCVAQTGTTH